MAAITDRQHGTRTGYQYGCRCDDCRAANTSYQRGRLHAARPAGAVRGLADPEAHALLSDILHELCPDGLTDDCPARREHQR